jgi:hypothetical protein
MIFAPEQDENRKGRIHFRRNEAGSSKESINYFNNICLLPDACCLLPVA